MGWEVNIQDPKSLALKLASLLHCFYTKTIIFLNLMEAIQHIWSENMIEWILEDALFYVDLRALLFTYTIPLPSIGFTSFLFWFGYLASSRLKNGHNSQSQWIASAFMPTLIIDSVYWNLFAAAAPCLMGVCQTKTSIIKVSHTDHPPWFSLCGGLGTNFVK